MTAAKNANVIVANKNAAAATNVTADANQMNVNATAVINAIADANQNQNAKKGAR